MEVANRAIGGETLRMPLSPTDVPLLHGPALTPMALVLAMVRAYEARGLDPGPVLKLAQIPTQTVHDPGARITASQMEVVSGAAMRELDDEALGCFDRALPWGSYGLLARASLSSPTLGVALRRWCRHHALLAADPLPVLEVMDDDARIALRMRHVAGAMAELCAVSLLRNIHGLASWYVDSRIPLHGAEFPYEPPPHVQAYAHLFDGPSRFGAEQAAIRFDARYLDLPLRRDEAAMNQLLQRALPLTVRSYRRDRLLALRVGQLLRARPGHSTESLAAALSFSPRTLQRQLAAEGTSLQALKDDARRERAIELLQRTRRPIKQVALAAGFQNEKSFIRAFKGWTGVAPGAFRGQG